MPQLTSLSLVPLAALASFGGVAAQDPQVRDREAALSEAQPPHHLIEVVLGSAAAHARMEALNLDLVACSGGQLAAAAHAEAIATDADLARIEEAGLQYRVVIRHLEAHHDLQARRAGPFPDVPTPPLGQGAMGGHYTLDQMVAILDKFAQDHPTICAAKVSIGTSIEGRDLWMVKISDNVGMDENEPEVLFDALHHAREPLGMETTILFMEELLTKYGNDPEMTYLVNERELYFVPCVNPDGYEYNRRTNPNGGGMWRKNRRGGFGVDLNRNYPTGWGKPGSSASQSASNYRGSAPLSEPETQAIENLILARSFVQVCSSHTYTDVLLTPFGASRTVPENFDPYRRVAEAATRTTGIRYGSFAVLLNYLGSGTTVDHHHAAHGALSWTPELGRSNEGGFWPNPTATVNIATRHQPMYRKIALLSGPNLADAELILMSTGQLGSVARLGMLGSNGATGVLAVSAGTASLPIQGIAGMLLLDPASTVLLPGRAFGSSGYLEVDYTIPNNSALSGGTVHWQMLHVDGPTLTLGNRQSLTLQ